MRISLATKIDGFWKIDNSSQIFLFESLMYNRLVGQNQSIPFCKWQSYLSFEPYCVCIWTKIHSTKMNYVWKEADKHRPISRIMHGWHALPICSGYNADVFFCDCELLQNRNNDDGNNYIRAMSTYFVCVLIQSNELVHRMIHVLLHSILLYYYGKSNRNQ